MAKIKCNKCGSKKMALISGNYDFLPDPEPFKSGEQKEI